MSLTDLKLEEKRFSSKEDIKPWLQESLTPRGINIVIERSDSGKMVFRCKTPRKQHYDMLRLRKARRHTSCPFRIRANYSTKNGTWTLVVMSDKHDHEVGNFGGDTVDMQIKSNLDLFLLLTSPEKKEPDHTEVEERRQIAIIKSISDHINEQILDNGALSDHEKSNVLRNLINHIYLEYKPLLEQSSGSSNSNVMPLLPLLNDSEPKYPASRNASMESLTQMPGLASGGNMSSSIAGGIGLGSFVPVNMQLPSFTLIQHQISLLPSLIDGSGTVLPNIGQNVGSYNGNGTEGAEGERFSMNISTITNGDDYKGEDKGDEKNYEKDGFKTDFRADFKTDYRNNHLHDINEGGKFESKGTRIRNGHLNSNATLNPLNLLMTPNKELGLLNLNEIRPDLRPSLIEAKPQGGHGFGLTSPNFHYAHSNPNIGNILNFDGW